jgi:hypothetical protein
VEVTNLHERRPKFEGSLNDTHDVIDDPADVLLEEIGLESIEAAGERLGEKIQRLASLGILGLQRRAAPGDGRP